jgi:acetylornithine deacetylase/succinyl-diaminopimelate desuccinylase-like protein
MSTNGGRQLNPEEQRYLDELTEFIGIPSVSTLSAHKGDVRRAAQWVANDLHRSGMENVRLIETQSPTQHPLIYADWLHAEGKPTIIIYGHYDVQPPDPLDEWQTLPFQATLRDGNLFARGSTDDKGQVYAHLKAVERLLKQDGKLPINVRFLIEGEEEVGGEGIEMHVKEHPDELTCEAVLISDSDLFADGLPAITVGLRGMVYTELTVRGAAHDLHSGSYGGVAPNAINTLCQIVAKLKNEQGVIQVPGFYDSVRPLTEQERSQLGSLPFNEDEMREHEMGSPALTGELGYSALERMWARPTLDANGIIGGFTGEGAKTVIPAVAKCKISMRLVPDQDPAAIAKAFKAYVESICPPYASVQVSEIHHAEPVLLPTDSPYTKAAVAALGEVFGKEPVLIRTGGSIPIVSLFSKVLGVPSILMGFGLPDDGPHAPNEKMKLDNVFKGIDASCIYMRLLAQ